MINQVVLCIVLTFTFKISKMPIATKEQYLNLMKKAKAGKYALPAINVVNLEGLNAVMEGLSECKSDGFIQFSLGGGAHVTGSLKNSVLGAKILAEAAHQLAEKHPCTIILHTDHCIPAKMEGFLSPLIKISKERVGEGKSPLFNSHMFDGSELALKENMTIAKKYLKQLSEIGMLIEVETGVVGGEEDGIDNSDAPAEKLYTTPEDMITVYQELSKIGDFLYAATFGNVHGVYKPGNVKLSPKILTNGQTAVKEKFNTIDNPLNLVFHGGSGSEISDIHEALDYGVIKMNVDTDTQYAFTRPIADHMYKNYDGVLRIDGEVGNKKVYDPRSYLKLGVANMKNRVIRAAEELRSAGQAW